MIRRLLTAVAAFALALAVVLFGAAWYFSGQIRSSALRVAPTAAARDIAVTALDAKTITLDDTDARVPGLHRAMLYELDWRGGSGLVRGEPTPGPRGVTRDFEVLQGTAPEVGTAVAANRDLVPPDDPAWAGATVVDFPSGDQVLPAWFVDGDTSTWAILVHGKGSSPAEMARMARATSEADLPTLSIGYRNDGGVPEEPGAVYGYGRTEWRDLAAAVAYAEDRGAEHVVLGGASMGGGIVAAYLERADIAPGLVEGVVLDAPMLDLERTVSWGARQEELPFGVPLPSALTWTAERLATLRFDLDWDAVDYLDDTGWVQVPTLVLHGDDDRTVPLATSEELAAAEPDLVTLEVYDAGHVEAYNSDPERYDDEVRGFLRSLS